MLVMRRQRRLALKEIWPRRQRRRGNANFSSSTVELPLSSWEKECPLVESICAYREHVSAELKGERAAIFMAGMPGSGKTRVIDALYGLEEPPTKVIDLDLEIKHHEAYDPERPELVYDYDGAYNWANNRVEDIYQAALLDDSFKFVVLDGTGTKIARRLRRIQQAKELGLTTVLLYVQISFEKAMERNARRKRVVPPHRLKEYQLLIEEAILAEKSHVDCFQTIDNDPEFSCRLAHIAQLQHDVSNLKPCVASTTHVRSYQELAANGHAAVGEKEEAYIPTLPRQNPLCARCGSLLVNGGLLYPQK